jgi:hypothetical protein
MAGKIIEASSLPKSLKEVGLNLLDEFQAHRLTQTASATTYIKDNRYCQEVR